MQRKDFYLKRNLGQHVLSDKAILNQLVNSLPLGPESKILEIGAGPGNLTHRLLKAGASVLAVEIDERFHYFLSPLVEEFPGKLKVFYGDFLKYQIGSLYSPGNWLAVGNLPYQITSPVIEKLLTEGRGVFSDLFLMVQKEVGERLAAAPGKKSFSSFSVFVQFYTEPEILFYVPTEAFFPAPEVTSAFVHLKIRKKPLFPVEEEKFFSFVRKLFLQRRKTLFNLLRGNYPKIFPELIKRALKDCSIDPEIRPEALKLESFYQLFTRLKPE